MDNTLLIIICIVSSICLLGFFLTKSKGFGKYNTSSLLLILCLSLASIFYAAGKLEADTFYNVIFAVIGFAGGLFAKSDNSV